MNENEKNNVSEETLLNIAHYGWMKILYKLDNDFGLILNQWKLFLIYLYNLQTLLNYK